MTEKEKVEFYISNKEETSMVDFKREFYQRIKNSDLPKDITAFANADSTEDKFIIFGVDDTSREVVGVNLEDIPSVDSINDYISETIEPFVNISLNYIQIENKTVAYIKIYGSNQNPPYIIKKTCGERNQISQGDIYIRKGSCNKKAGRLEIDDMYLNNGTVTVNIFENFIVIKPIIMEGEIPPNPTEGIVKLEIYNDSTRPYLITHGYIEIIYGNYKIERIIHSILPNKMISERPIQIMPKTRQVYTALFDFSSQDCVNIGFDEEGFLENTIQAKVCLQDTDGNKFFTEPIDALLFAKGDILHKVRLEKGYKKRKPFMLNIFGRR